jgi:hypothetical protein
VSISQSDVKILFLQSGGICAYPDCGLNLVEPATDADNAVLLAHIAHIVAESPDGPRGNSSLSIQERNRHPNLLVLCTPHHTIVDSQLNTYGVAVLHQMKLDHERRIRQLTARSESEKSAETLPETVYSTLLPVTHLPAVIFTAPCDLPDDQTEVVRAAIKYPDDKWQLLPFLLRERTLFAFQNLRDPANPFREIIDYRGARAVPTAELWATAEGQRRFSTLLNRSLYKYTARLDVRFDPPHRRFYFPPNQAGKTRVVRYKTGTRRRSTKKVVWQPITRLTGKPKKHWRHLAAALKFQRLADRQWCLSIRPERHLTQDGLQPLPPQQIGPRVTKLKAKMYNGAYLTEVHFWRDYLSQDGRRITLNFGEQIASIDWSFLQFTVRSPGIPGDVTAFENRAPDDDLFSSTELDAYLSGESTDEEADGEDDVEEDDVE